jgi:hypothetical protein
MDNYLANKIIEDLTIRKMTTTEAWRNLKEVRDVISDEKHDEITALITEQLIDAEVVGEVENFELEDIFAEDDMYQMELDWGDTFAEPCNDPWSDHPDGYDD